MTRTFRGWWASFLASTRIAAVSTALCVTVSEGQSAGGHITVTAVVQSSATWVQQADGTWKLMVVNAADPSTTFTAYPVQPAQNPTQGAQTQIAPQTTGSRKKQKTKAKQLPHK